MEVLSPLKAVRKECLNCCCGQANEVKICPSVECDLFGYRFGKSPKNKKMSTIKAIKLHCYNCQGFNKAEVERCEFIDCPIYPYRKGKNPSLTGKRPITPERRVTLVKQLARSRQKRQNAN